MVLHCKYAVSKVAPKFKPARPKGYSPLGKLCRKKKATAIKSPGKLISTLVRRVWLLPMKAINRFFTLLLCLPIQLIFFKGITLLFQSSPGYLYNFPFPNICLSFSYCFAHFQPSSAKVKLPMQPHQVFFGVWGWSFCFVFCLSVVFCLSAVV